MVDIKFTLEDCKIIYECTGMDERLREILDFMAKNSFEFCSELYPEIRINVINLRGEDKSQDNNAQIINFNSIYKRDSFIEGVKEAFEELKVYLKKEYPDDYTEPTLTIIDKDEKESDKIIEDVKENEEYEYLTVEKAKALYDQAEEIRQRWKDERKKEVEKGIEKAIRDIDNIIKEEVCRGNSLITIPYSLFVPNDFSPDERIQFVNKLEEHYTLKGFIIVINCNDIDIRLFPKKE